MDELRAAVEVATADPEGARRLLALLTAFCSTRSCFDRIRGSLVACGVPERFLPQQQEVNDVDPALRLPRGMDRSALSQMVRCARPTSLAIGVPFAQQPARTTPLRTPRF